MWVEFHIHTNASKDSINPLWLIKKISKKRVLCITDHNTIKGALKLKKENLNVIVGEEIYTTEGEIIGLFLTEEIKPNLTVEETIEKIKEQGGIAIAPHPFDEKRKGLKEKAIKAEIIEIFNSRSFYHENEKALSLAEKNNKLKIVGSDAHLPIEIGLTSIWLKNEVYDSKEFLRELRHASFNKKPSPYLFYKKLIKSKSNNTK